MGIERAFKTDSPRPLDSILEAQFTVSPNKQYRGIFSPTTPATHDPTRVKMRK